MLPVAGIEAWTVSRPKGRTQTQSIIYILESPTICTLHEIWDLLGFTQEMETEF